MAKKYIQLPKGYISYSQLVLWQNDKKRYKQIYFDARDELRTTNAGMEYGKVVANALEHGLQTDDLLTDSAMLLLPKYDLADQEIEAEMKTKEGWIRVLGKPDSMDSKTKAFYEFKTGKNPWTKRKAQEHLQMRFYAMLIYLKHKVMLKDAKLIWIETFFEDKGGKRIVTPTGRVQEFTVTFTTKDILDCMALTAAVAKEIEIEFASHIPDKNITEF